MKNIQKQGNIIALTGTVLLWTLLTVLGIYIKISPPVPDYKEIQIQLDDFLPEEKVILSDKVSNEKAADEQKISTLEDISQKLSETTRENDSPSETKEIAEIEPVMETPAEEPVSVPELVVEEVIPAVEKSVPVEEPAPVVPPLPQSVYEPEASPVAERFIAAESVPKPAESVPAPESVSMPVESVQITESVPVPEETVQIAEPDITEPEIVTPSPEPVVQETQKTEYKPELQKSVDELMSETNTRRKEKKEFDWSMLEDDEDIPVTSTPKKASGESKSSFVVNEKSTETPKIQNEGKTSSSAGKKSEQKATAETKSRLDEIKNTSASQPNKSKENSSADVPVKNSEGRLTMKMSDGSSRQLVFPADPFAFKLSKKSASTVESNLNIRIEFTVNKDGTVPVTGIVVKDRTIISEAVYNEIINWIRQWRFNEDKSVGKAQFTLNIKNE